jgi:hypothetical protein
VLAAADAAPETAKNFLHTMGGGKGIMLAVGGLLGGIVAYWLSSILFAQEKASLKRALLTMLALMGAGVAAVALFMGGLAILGRAPGTFRTVLFVSGVAVFFLGLVVLVPMKVYGIGVFRSIGLLLIAWMLSFGFQVVLAAVIPGDEVLPLQAGSAREWFRKAIPLIPRDRAAELRALRIRRTDLAERHGRLTIQYRHMLLSDDRSVRAYVRERAAYERDLESFKADLAEATGL